MKFKLCKKAHLLMRIENGMIIGTVLLFLLNCLWLRSQIADVIVSVGIGATIVALLTTLTLTFGKKVAWGTSSARVLIIVAHIVLLLVAIGVLITSIAVLS